MASRRTNASPYPQQPITRTDRLDVVLQMAKLAIHESIDYSNKPDLGWGTTKREEILSEAQKAMYSLNIELAPLLMARDNLEHAIISMERAKEKSNWNAPSDV